jgi:sulfofructose kinase
LNHLHGEQSDRPADYCVATVGLAVVDHVYQLDQIPTKAEKHFASSLQEVVGGIAANAALAIVALGRRAKLFTRVGDDSAGKFVVDDLRRSGVEVNCLEIVTGQTTASSAVFLDRDGERMIVNYKPTELFSSPPRSPDLEQNKIGAVLGDLRWVSGTEAVFALAKPLKIPTVLDFDLAPDDVSQVILNNTSHIIFAESALKKYTRKIDLSAAMRAVHSKYPNIHLAVTAGADGVLHMNKDGQIGHIKSRSVSVVSTLGAGDIFHGAAAMALMEGASFERALHFANDVAAVMISKPINEAKLPTRFEVEELQRNFQ